MEFVSFEIAKKLKEKGFTCELPFAMYNELGKFCLLTTSAPYYVCSSGFKFREYYSYDDFDEKDCVAPTISQVLKWLRKEKKIHICVSYSDNIRAMWEYEAILLEGALYQNAGSAYVSYEQAALAGIEYVLDNLI